MNAQPANGWRAKIAVIAMSCALVASVSVAVLWPMYLVHATDLTHEQLYAMTAPGVVFVYGSSGKEGMVGGGSLVRSDGLILTNAHVVLEQTTGSPHDHLWTAVKPDRVAGNFDEDLKNRFPAKVQALNQDLEDTAREMRKSIHEKRDRDQGGSTEQARDAPPHPSRHGTGSEAGFNQGAVHGTGGQTA